MSTRSSTAWTSSGSCGNAMRSSMRAHVTRPLRWLTWRLRVARMATAMAAVAVAVRYVPLPRLSALFGLRLDDERTITAHRKHGPTPGAGGAVRLTHSETQDYKALRRAAQRWPTSHGTCLYEALVLGRILRRHAPILKVGVARAGPTVHAHAWLELGGSTIGARHGFAELSTPAADAR